MRLLLDEMHSPSVARALRDREHDVLAVKERAHLIGLVDADLLQLASAERMAIVTENVKDFAVLHQRITAGGHHHAGLVFTHPRRFDRAARNHVRVLADALAAFLDAQTAVLSEAQSWVWWLERQR